MLQPLRLALVLALTLASGAAAQAQPAMGARVERQRSVTITSTPAEPLPVIHVAAGAPTLLLFSAPIQRKTLTFDESRIRVLDAGERSVIVQPVVDLREGERQEMGVFFADGRAPARAAFVLVTVPAEVDSRIDVRRSEPPSPACPSTAQTLTPRPEDFVLLGFVKEAGVTTSIRKDMGDSAQGLELQPTVSFRGAGWILADVKFMNSPDHPAWTPQEATFAGRLGAPRRARFIMEKQGPILPGERGRVLAVMEIPETETDLVFTLEVRGDGGRRLTIQDVRFPKLASEDAR
ncbi:DUF2381 family protein [Corallococcus macrosporus]|uniref:DUF2381 family protein n=1 Tax=Myxococcus fulvus (strain ATCC BAA-855 / HW-1) TaxID=483219 RepID=F8CM65_MYXFH|nr:DUF2381 family protein [Corallococcus macrosporus]AEI62833.1 hypothetical protein LILAB_04560 [Corallococcus macrosporus]